MTFFGWSVVLYCALGELLFPLCFTGLFSQVSHLRDLWHFLGGLWYCTVPWENFCFHFASQASFPKSVISEIFDIFWVVCGTVLCLGRTSVSTLLHRPLFPSQSSPRSLTFFGWSVVLYCTLGELLFPLCFTGLFSQVSHLRDLWGLSALLTAPDWGQRVRQRGALLWFTVGHSGTFSIRGALPTGRCKACTKLYI